MRVSGDPHAMGSGADVLRKSMNRCFGGSKFVSVRFDACGLVRASRDATNMKNSPSTIEVKVNAILMRVFQRI